MHWRCYFSKLSPFLWQARCMFCYGAAFVWRRLLFRTTFIGITGSVGKTTAKECLAAILSSRFSTTKTIANQNDYSGLPLSILRVRPWNRFAVMEVAAGQPGQMRRSARLLRPDVAIVLAVARTHTKSLRTLDRIAAEKAELPAALTRQGVAVLNSDDSYVASIKVPMGRRTVRFGSEPRFMYWATGESSRWPQRLSFYLHAGDPQARPECRLVQTQLVGVHWKGSVLGAIAAAHICGLDFEDILESVARVKPTSGRMQPAPLPGGAVIIRDDFNGSIATLKSALEVLRNAEADRKFLVVSDVTDSPKRPRERLAEIGKEVAGFLHSVIFLGSHAPDGLRGALAGGMAPEQIHTFPGWQQAAEFLKSELTAGDLVMVRAGFASDHLDRLYHALLGSVACQKARCDKRIQCDLCAELGASLDARELVPALIEIGPRRN